MSDSFEATAKEYEAAAELEAAARHLHVSARHFREREVPRGCAHAWAATGHRTKAERLLDALAEQHAAMSSTE